MDKIDVNNITWVKSQIDFLKLFHIASHWNHYKTVLNLIALHHRGRAFKNYKTSKKRVCLLLEDCSKIEMGPNYI